MDFRVSLSGERPTEPPVRNLSGVGLLRGEFIFRDREVYVTDQHARADLVRYVSMVCDAFANKPVWYRLSDFWSDEANVLRGCEHIVVECNPIIGNRGIRRALAHPDDFSLEIEAIANVARSHTNLHLLIPFVQDGDEMAEAALFCRRAGWRGRLGSMLEVPSALFCAADLVRAGATNLLLGLNDLTSLLLARERGLVELKLHDAVWKAVSTARDAIQDTEWGVAGSMSRAIVERAAAHGAHYVSVHYEELPDVIGTPVTALADVNFVRQVKEKTRAAKKRLREAQTS